ncbi:MAG: molecular chaperone TorD family protein [Thermodesulfobacteriota bacterium]
MMPAGTSHAGLRFVSQLFSYPEQLPVPADLPAGMAAEAGALMGEMVGVAAVRLQNEYVRLFVNALPEVPCPPYGSVYLEGSLMGETTLMVRGLYRKYGLEPAEMPDHIAVESEFLAWLQGLAVNDTAARQDFEHLLGHLQEWTGPFFDRVEQHDQLGCYRQSARLARAILNKHC